MTGSEYAFGLTKDVLQKIEAKYDVALESEAMRWIEAVTGQSFYNGQGADYVHQVLKDGTILCKLMNVLKPGSVKKVNNSKIAFMQMENINSFLSAATAYGVAASELFQTVDLFEKNNMHQVILTITAVGRRAQVMGFNGPVLGPKESSKNEREFTEAQLKQGETIVPMQMGGFKGATASGQVFGKNRSILD